MALKQKTFLIFSPHPDDADFGCAGTAAVLTAKRHEVIYCVLTNGEKGTHKINQECAAMVAMRETEQRAGARAVGVSKVIFLGVVDGTLENTPETRRAVVRVIRKVKPHVVMSHDPANQRFDTFGRFHRDHRVGAEIVFDAIYPAAGSASYFPELSEENLLPHQIEEAWFFGTDRPNHAVDITAAFEKKIAALHAHQSQFENMADIEKRIRARARAAGRKKGWRYAEAFRRLAF
jgi:LmbE family N-acetylglucosaminyl deacetylase